MDEVTLITKKAFNVCKILKTNIDRLVHNDTHYYLISIAK